MRSTGDVNPGHYSRTIAQVTKPNINHKKGDFPEY